MNRVESQARVARVASRYLATTAAAEFAEYQTLFHMLEHLIAESKTRPPVNQYGLEWNWHESPTRPMGLRKAFPAFLQAGRDWCHEIIDNRAIPSGKHKAVELVARLLDKPRMPKDWFEWFDTNKARFQLLVEAGAWPARSEGSDIRMIGPFQVHDTMGSSEADWAKAEQVITRAVHEFPHTGLPGFASMAYGALYLVGQLQYRRDWVAWYFAPKDLIYFRPNIKGSSLGEDVRVLIHELAHRYYQKKLPLAQKEEWVQHHEDMRSAVHFAVGKLPEVGEVLPYRSNGKELRVTEFKYGYVFFEDAKNGEALGKIHSSELQHLLAKEEARINHAKYPTDYASTDAEEHFCEAVSLRAMGRLDRDNLAVFDEIFG